MTTVGRRTVHAAIVGVVAFLFLLPPIPVVNKPFCTYERVPIGHALTYRLDVDSPVFLDIAYEPAYLFIDHGEWRSRQARPLYPLAACALTPIFSGTPGLRRMSGHPSYPAYVVLNLATLIAVLGVFTALVGNTARAWTLGTLVGVLLFSNDVAKVFVWTPHTQLFNLGESLGCAWLIREMAARPILSWRRLAACGVVGGLLLLAYGSFILFLASMLIGLAARGWTARAPGRMLVEAGIACLAFVLPLVAWALFAHHHTGSFHIGEAAECRDFVWILDAWQRGGATRLGQAFGTFTANFFDTLGRELVIPFFAVGTVLVLRATSWERTRTVLRHRRATVLACVVACGLNLVFFWLMGNARACYAARLTFNVLPPLLALAAVALAGVLEEQRERTWYLSLAAIGAFVVAAHLYVLVKPGPWC